MSWERFCNWLEAKPWRYRYGAIWRGYTGPPSFWKRLWETITFPHVHHEDEDAIEALQDVAARPALTDADTRARVELAREWLTAHGYDYPNRGRS